jgi:cytochrome b6-f complex iron-sulfur subunit
MLTRRKFLKTIGGALALSTPPLFLPGCAAGLATYHGEFDGNAIAIPKASATALNTPNGMMMVRARNLPVPLVVRHLEGEGLIALSTICTHAGCEVRVMPDEFECPCHGSAYNLDGSVSNGPASRPLQRFVIDETPEAIIIKVKP